MPFANVVPIFDPLPNYYPSPPTPNPKPTNKPMNINILETSDDKEPLKLYHL